MCCTLFHPLHTAKTFLIRYCLVNLFAFLIFNELSYFYRIGPIQNSKYKVHLYNLNAELFFVFLCQTNQDFNLTANNLVLYCFYWKKGLGALLISVVLNVLFFNNFIKIEDQNTLLIDSLPVHSIIMILFYLVTFLFIQFLRWHIQS